MIYKKQQNGSLEQLYRQGNEVEYQPYTLQAVDDALTDILGYTTKQYKKDLGVCCEVLGYKRDHFGINSFTVGLGLRSVGKALGSVETSPDKGAGNITRYLLADYSELSQIKDLDPMSSDYCCGILRRAQDLHDIFPDMHMKTCVAGPFTTAASIRPPELILRDTIKHSEELHELLGISVRSSLNWLRAVQELFGDVEATFADPFTSISMLSPHIFREFALPHLHELCDGIREIMHHDPGLHICGRSKEIWEDLAGLGLSFLSLDNCENLYEAKEIIGDKVLLSGNVNPVDTMLQGTPDQVIAEVRKCLIECADSPRGFILNTGCQVPIGTPKENIDAFVSAAKDLGSGALLGHLPKGLKNKDNAHDYEISGRGIVPSR